MSLGDGGYNPGDYPPVAVTVDVALFAIQEGQLHVLLIERGVEPFAGAWALPGGFVQPDEGLDAAAARELAEETGVSSDSTHLEQLRSYGSPGRDPRMRVVTVAYWGACAELPSPIGSSDAADAELVPVSQVEEGGIELAFDHGVIVADALERVRAKLEYTPLAAQFCAEEFTISELRKVYEAVWDAKLDPGNFQRKVRENRAFQKVGPAEGSAVLRSSSDMLASEACYSVAEASRDFEDRAIFQAVAGSELGPARPRSGRPASLWISTDAEGVLNSPIHRRGRSRQMDASDISRHGLESSG